MVDIKDYHKFKGNALKIHIKGREMNRLRHQLGIWINV